MACCVLAFAFHVDLQEICLKGFTIPFHRGVSNERGAQSLYNDVGKTNRHTFQNIKKIFSELIPVALSKQKPHNWICYLVLFDRSERVALSQNTTIKSWWRPIGPILMLPYTHLERITGASNPILLKPPILAKLCQNSNCQPCGYQSCNPFDRPTFFSPFDKYLRPRYIDLRLSSFMPELVIPRKHQRRLCFCSTAFDLFALNSLKT